MQVVPLKVTMTKASTGVQYPAFNQVDAGLRRNLDWKQYVDVFGGWNYDRKSGFGESDPEDSPGGGNPDPWTWVGCILVEPGFAEQAVKLFPDQCCVLTEAEFEAFHDCRSHESETEERVNADVVAGIRAKYGITGALTLTEIAKRGDTLDPADLEALNPTHPSPGIVRNVRKKWAWFKAARNLSIDHDKVAELKGGKGTRQRS